MSSRILYDQLRVRRFSSSAITPTNMPSTITLSITDPNASPWDLPTHLIACFTTSRSRPYIIPINIDRYRRVFRTEIVPSTLAVPAPTRTHTTITLPLVVPITTVPHPPSLTFLLLQDISDNDIAFQMLPPNVVGEFPNAAAMAQVMSFIGKEEFEKRQAWNGGIWRNILGLGARNERVVGVVRTAWNVTVDAKRLRGY